mmetsp:Transcript_13339/g.27025  ORF Transcript_13339/g.27025 Transcript_13339/m.27025 type:complete len:131 (-) Transcript_13339:351-743(-)|eukprot:CAMPEP_0167782144 /NCGR_PEP_ID=MMETSP0111_2-20121227/6349_1 /TAXON_ID=91324 /ORGANISM="Lotharella globosa, Strain CCCM811" /LENGTH=130 /DNA_ID=CAMNT_0007672933 /DNA_START=119 /DNA_END=511 /DNA_ORIENTATION=+
MSVSKHQRNPTPIPADLKPTSKTSKIGGVTSGDQKTPLGIHSIPEQSTTPKGHQRKSTPLPGDLKVGTNNTKKENPLGTISEQPSPGHMRKPTPIPGKLKMGKKSFKPGISKISETISETVSEAVIEEER